LAKEICLIDSDIVHPGSPGTGENDHPPAISDF